MKPAFYLSFFIILLTSCSSQLSTMKLYGYKQAISPGKPTGYEIDEAGQPITMRHKVRLNYFVYLTHPANLTIEPLELWINGDLFGLRAEKLPAPVEMRYDDGPFETGKEILVPATSDILWNLVPTGKTAGKPWLLEGELAQANELVLVYRKNNRTRNLALKSFKTLTTAVMQ